MFSIANAAGAIGRPNTATTTSGFLSCDRLETLIYSGMTGARETVAAEFLRKALAAEPLGVAKLNAMARAAGLLTERQRITNARVFRQAKTALGIQSVRDGFGPRGGWAWELPRDREERAPTPSAIGPQLSRKERAI